MKFDYHQMKLFQIVDILRISRKCFAFIAKNIRVCESYVQGGQRVHWKPDKAPLCKWLRIASFRNFSCFQASNSSGSYYKNGVEKLGNCNNPLGCSLAIMLNNKIEFWQKNNMIFYKSIRTFQPALYYS